MRQIKRIFIHCTASPQTWNADKLMESFRSLGWKAPGYHYAVADDGTVYQLIDEDCVANGVKGYNATAIHVAYIGGIDSNMQAVDNRTPRQKTALRTLLQELRTRYPKAQILGHRDISPDTNNNGRVDTWERIKECPCFNAIPEYNDL